MLVNRSTDDHDYVLGGPNDGRVNGRFELSFRHHVLEYIGGACFVEWHLAGADRRYRSLADVIYADLQSAVCECDCERQSDVPAAAYHDYVAGELFLSTRSRHREYLRSDIWVKVGGNDMLRQPPACPWSNTDRRDASQRNPLCRIRKDPSPVPG